MDEANGARVKPHIKRHKSGLWMIYLSRNDHIPLVAGRCVYEAWREYEHWFRRVSK